jgi:hypothetical protein
MTAGRGEIRQIDVEVLLASGAVVGGVGHQKIDGMTGRQVAAIVQCAMTPLMASGQMATAGTQRVLMVTIIGHDPRRREVLDVGDPFGGIRHIFTGSKPHGGPSSQQ